MKDIIVYVDDDLDDHLLLKEAFKDFNNYNLFTFYNVDQLFNFLDGKANKICLIILDINIPGKNGIDILKDLKAHPVYRFLSVVMFSTTRSIAETNVIKDLGSEVVIKPATSTSLQEKASELLSYC